MSFFSTAAESVCELSPRPTEVKFINERLDGRNANGRRTTLRRTASAPKDCMAILQRSGIQCLAHSFLKRKVLIRIRPIEEGEYSGNAKLLLSVVGVPHHSRFKYGYGNLAGLVFHQFLSSAYKLDRVGCDSETCHGKI